MTSGTWKLFGKKETANIILKNAFKQGEINRILIQRLLVGRNMAVAVSNYLLQRM